MLREREIRWRRGKSVKEISVEVAPGNGLYGLDGGHILLGNGMSGISVLKLPSAYDSSNVFSKQWRVYELPGVLAEYGLDVENQDLIAAVTRYVLELPSSSNGIGADSRRGTQYAH